MGVQDKTMIFSLITRERETCWGRSGLGLSSQLSWQVGESASLRHCGGKTEKGGKNACPTTTRPCPRACARWIHLTSTGSRFSLHHLARHLVNPTP